MNIRPARRPPPASCVGLALVLASLLPASADTPQRPGGSYRRFTHDGAWCWFSDPRAVYYAGRHQRTYAGWVNSQGDVVVGAYDHRMDTVQTTILHRKLERDDHAAPSLVVLPDGRLRVFYSKHRDTVMRTRLSERPENIESWGPERELALDNLDKSRPDRPGAICYSNPIALNSGALVLFWRGINYKPCLGVSHDLGRTFEYGRIVFDAPGVNERNRPYLKAACNDGNTIHLAFTTGHPRTEQHNSIYYCAFDGHTFRHADGTVIGTVDDLPLGPAQCDVVHDGRKLGVRGWIWDIAADELGRPAVVYAQLPRVSRHVYYYARWDGSAWAARPIVDAGAWFPQTPYDEHEREPHYSAGVVLDHADPRRVYLARPRLGVFEIERWEFTESSDQWTHTAITAGSQYDNVRPVAIRNAPEAGPHVLWMCVDRRYEYWTSYGCSIRMDRPEPPRIADALNPRTIQQTMERVGHWQLANPTAHPGWDWTNGALYAGMMALVRTSQDASFEQALLATGRELGWKPGPREFFADDHCVGQMYLEMYMRHRDEAMLSPIRAVMDAVVQQPPAESLEFTDDAYLNNWVWCDALFMAPPTLARLYEATEDLEYLQTLDRRWWQTTDYLYDPEEHLFYRDSRFFDKREANGEKVFWSRGNGWVLAGLARVLQSLPADYPSRPRYQRLFVEMSARIAKLQQPDGLWRSSLLDPASYPHPETSGSGFYCFALAWGVNTGLLDRDAYRPVVERAWTALVRCVDANGMLEWVQQIGADPRHVRAAHTDVYGVGALLLAGEQVQLLMRSTEPPSLVGRGWGRVAFCGTPPLPCLLPRGREGS